MNIFESILSAFSSVFANKMRSMLTMLGIIIGISSVIMVMSVGDGVQKSTTEQFSQLGFDAIAIQMSTSASETKSSDYLTLDDMATLKLSENVTYVSPMYVSNAYSKLKNPNETSQVSITGTTFEFMYTQPIEMYYGRFLIDMDEINRSDVAIIDSAFAKKVFGKEDAVGEKLTLYFENSSKEVTIIGICKGIEFGPFYEAPGMAYMPISTLMGYENAIHMSGYYAAVADKDKANETVNELSRLLSIKHKNKDKYSIQNLMLQADMMNTVMSSLTMFVSFVAGISLLVGGIGVMNIMLVTVTERTREIGIRKSLGATDSNIQFQFLIESLILSLLGGAIGLAFGYLGGSLVGIIMNIQPLMTPAAVIITVSISSAIGIIFGVYPAGKAAKLNPIDALRYE